LTHWAISLGDQPLVRFDTLERLLAFATAHPREVCQPARAGRGRHPVWLPARVFARLPESDAADLKQFLVDQGAPPARCEIDDAGLDLDLDEPADYERALRLAATPAL
jgi:molybdenum cofactor cytidylyltransferase